MYYFATIDDYLIFNEFSVSQIFKNHSGSPIADIDADVPEVKCMGNLILGYHTGVFKDGLVISGHIQYVKFLLLSHK